MEAALTDGFVRKRFSLTWPASTGGVGTALVQSSGARRAKAAQEPLPQPLARAGPVCVRIALGGAEGRRAAAGDADVAGAVAGAGWGWDAVQTVLAAGRRG